MVVGKSHVNSQLETPGHNSRTVLICLLWYQISCYMWDYVTCELQERHSPNGHWDIPAALWTVAVVVWVQWACEHTTIVEQFASTPSSCKAQFLYIVPVATVLPKTYIQLFCNNVATAQIIISGLVFKLSTSWCITGTLHKIHVAGEMDCMFWNFISKCSIKKERWQL